MRLAGWAVLVAVGGCGQSPVLDSEGLEEEIGRSLVPDAPEAVSDVRCPDVIVEGPITIGCVATIGTTPVDVTVSISAEDTASISTDAVVVEVAAMETAAASRLSADLGVETTVTCPGSRVIVTIAGATLDCEAVDSTGGKHPVSFTILSEEGDWELAIG